MWCSCCDGRCYVFRRLVCPAIAYTIGLLYGVLLHHVLLVMVCSPLHPMGWCVLGRHACVRAGSAPTSMFIMSTNLLGNLNSTSLDPEVSLVYHSEQFRPLMPYVSCHRSLALLFLPRQLNGCRGP